MAAKYVRYNEEEWSALYIDGKLSVVGDSYLSDEKIAELLGVEERDDDAFMQGGKNYSDVANTLAEVEAYAASRDAKLREAAALRARAEELEAEAKLLTAEADKA
jgi:hypothetical protein